MPENIITIAELDEVTTAPDGSYIAIDNGTTTNKISVRNYNVSSSLNSYLYSKKAEGYALGTRDGIPQEQGQAYYHNNAKYYSEQAASFASTVSDNIATAEEQVTSAIAAKNSAESYAGAAESSATQASQSASAAAGSASTASGYATSASNSATSANTSAQSASASASDALGYKDTAVGAASDAQGYANDAERYASAASASADAAAAVAVRTPYVGENGNWFVWDAEENDFVDSGEKAQGDKGDTGNTGATPTISMTATTDAIASPNPSVTVTKSGTDAAPSFAMAFTGLKGPKGDTGNTGPDGYSPAVTISTISGGHTVTITDKDHPSGQNFNVMDGTGAGDMLSSTYDSTSAVANAGGIASYVGGAGIVSYDNLSNQPRINNIRLTGNKTSGDLGLQPNMSTAATYTFGALSSVTTYLNAGRILPNNCTIHINEYDTDYNVLARAESDTETNCIFISTDKKIVPISSTGVLDIRAFGAGHTNTAADSTKIVKAIKYAQSNRLKLFVPTGRWYIKENIPLTGTTIIEGATSGGDRGLYAATGSILFFDPEQSNISMFTELTNHTISIRHLTIICGKIETVNEREVLSTYTTYTGEYTTESQEIPHNYMTWTYSYDNVHCLNCYNSGAQVPRDNASWLDLLDVNIVGFSGYGVKCGMALALDSVRFMACKYGFYNALTDTQFHNTFIQGCEYGFYWNNGGTVIFAYDTWIDQCKYGVYSTAELSGLFDGGEIDHCLYAGFYIGSVTWGLTIRCRLGRLGMYYLGEDMLAKAQLVTTYSDADFDDISKGVDIAIKQGARINIDVDESPKVIPDNGIGTYTLPSLFVFGWKLYSAIIKTVYNFGANTYYAIDPSESNVSVINVDQKITDKATKVSSATSGHFAGLDSSGNLTDSGKSASDFSLVTTDHDGTASASATSVQRIGIDGSYTEIDGTKYMEQTITLSTSASVTATFTNAAILSTSDIEVHAGRASGDILNSKNSFPYESIYTTAGSCAVTFPKEDTSFDIKVRIYIR